MFIKNKKQKTKMSGKTGHVASPHICCKVKNKKRTEYVGVCRNEKERECCSIVKSMLLFPDVQYSNLSLLTIDFLFFIFKFAQ